MTSAPAINNSMEITGNIQGKVGKFPKICPNTRKATRISIRTSNADQTMVFFDMPESTTANSASK
jgi:hypothetical protein